MGNQQDPTVSGSTPPSDRRESAEDRFGENLRYERERRAMTQADVAHALAEVSGINLHPSAIAKMEQREVAKPRSIRLDEAFAIAQLFGTTVDKMVTIRSELEDLAIQFEQLASLVQHVEIAEDLAFQQLRRFGPFMRADVEDAPFELKMARSRIVRSMAEVQLWREKVVQDQRKAERLANELGTSPVDKEQDQEG